MKRICAHPVFLMVTSLFWAVLISCGGGGGGSDSSGGSLKVVSISVTPSNPSMLTGGTRKLTVSGTFSDNVTRDITTYSNVVWSSSNPAVATFAGGNVSAKGEGTATITASMDEATGSATVTVTGVTKKVILYIATSADTSQYFADYNTTVESSSQTLIRYVPDANLADVVDQNNSYSFAPSTIYPYTVDNRFFIRREVRPSEYSGSHTIVEYDPKTNQQILSFGVNEPNTITVGCAAIVDSGYFYSISRTYDYLYGDQGGEFMKMILADNASGSGTQLVAYGQYDSCKYNLGADNGTLYDASYFDYNQTTKYLEIYKRDLTTGKIIPAASKSWTVTDAAQYQNTTKFAFDGGFAYWVRMRTSDKQIEIYRDDFVDSSPTQVYANIIPNINSISFFVASNGYLAIGDAAGYIFLYDVNANASSMINVGLSYYALQILYLP